jgi:hypothetical protein
MMTNGFRAEYSLDKYLQHKSVQQNRSRTAVCTEDQYYTPPPTSCPTEVERLHCSCLALGSTSKAPATAVLAARRKPWKEAQPRCGPQPSLPLGSLPKHSLACALHKV